MRKLDTYLDVRPFLAHEVDACSRLQIPVESAVLVGSADGDIDQSLEDGSISGLQEFSTGVGKGVALDVRTKSVRLQSEFTNSYWNIPRGMLNGAPPPTTTESIAREIATPAVEEFLAGNDVCFSTLGARVSGKTHLLFGHPLERKPSCSILSTFIEGVFEAFGGEVYNENQVMISAIEVLPNGTALNLLDGAEPLNSFNESFEAAIPGWNPIWELICVVFEKLEGLRSDGCDRGTTLISFRVQRRDATNVENCPLAVFMESEPICAAGNTNSVFQNEIRKMASDEAMSPTNPWAINLVLEAHQGRIWSTRVIACVSPSPTALQASLTVMGLVSQFNPKCFNNSHNTPKREIKGVLAFSPDDPPVPKTDIPTPTIPAPALNNISVAQLLQTPGTVSDTTALETTPGASASQVSESVCTELLGLVKLLKGEVETLRGELADERRRNHETDRRQSEQSELSNLKNKNKTLEKECHERNLQLEVVAGEKRTIERELRILEQNQTYGNLYEDIGAFAKRSSSVTRGRRGASKSPVALKKTQPESGDQRYSRQGTTISNLSDSKVIRKRSSTPPSAVRTTLRSTSVGRAGTGRRGSLTSTTLSKSTGGGSRVPSLISETTTPSGASSPRTKVSLQYSTQIVKDKSPWIRQTNKLNHPFKSTTPATPLRASRQFTLTKTPKYTTI